MQTIKRVIIPLFIFLMLVVTTSFSTVGLGEQTDHIEDFEDDTLGTQAHDDYYGFEWFYTQNYTGYDAEVSNVHAYTGTKSYFIDDGADVLMTMNESDIYNISFYWRPHEYANIDPWIYCDFNNATNDSIIKIRFVDGALGKLSCQYKAWNGVWTQLGAEVNEDTWHNFGFEITDIDAVTYYWATNNYSGTPNTIVTDIDDASINYAFWNTTYHVGIRGMYLDNFSTITGFNETGTGGYSDIPLCTTTDSIGSLTQTGGAITTTNRVIYASYLVEGDYYIDTLGIRCSYLMDTHSYDGYDCTPMDFRLKINDNDCGVASEKLYISSTAFILLWNNLDITIDSETLHMALRSDHQIISAGTIFYWMASTGNQGVDILTDGYIRYGLDGLAYFNDFENIYDSYPPATMIHTNDPTIRICLDKEGTHQVKDFVNFVGAYPNTVCPYHSVNIHWRINFTTFASGGTFVIWVNDVPRYIDGQDGYYSYTPSSTGLYHVNLTLNGVNVSYTTFTCSDTGCDTDNWIYTNPNPTLSGGFFYVFYNYSSSYDGIITASRGSTVVQTWHIQAESGGTLSVDKNNFADSGCYYFELKAKTSGYDYPVLATHVHGVGGAITDYIQIESEWSGYGTTTVPVGTEVNFIGEHQYPAYGLGVFIKVGYSYLPEDLSCTPEFSVWYTPINSGTYEIGLYLKEEDDEVQLANCTLIVSAESSIVVEPVIFPNLGATLGMIVGVIFTGFFTLIPLFVSIGFSHKQVNVPIIIYPMFACLGTILSVTMGFFEPYVMYFIIAIGLIVIAILYLTKSNNNGG